MMFWLGGKGANGSSLLADIQVEHFQWCTMELLQVLISDANSILKTELLQGHDMELEE